MICESLQLFAFILCSSGYSLSLLCWINNSQFSSILCPAQLLSRTQGDVKSWFWIKLVTVMITFPPPSDSLKSYPLHVRTRHAVTVDQLWSSETRASTLIVDEASVPSLWLHCFCAPFWDLPQEVWGDELTHISQGRASPLLTLGPSLSCALEDV